MKFQHIIRVVTSEPWLITPAAHDSILKLIEAHTSGQPVADLAELFDKEQPAMHIDESGVAVIPVKGVIGKGLSAIEKSCGAVGVEDIARDLAQANADPTVQAIMLDIDSPGGSVSGVPELGEAISNSRKTVFAYTEGQMASAAYWLAAGARQIYATKSADIGSIGVYLPWADQSKRYEAEGVKMEVIKNTGGTFKGMGVPGTSLTEAQRAHLQERVDDIFAMFTNHVTSHRPQVKAEAMQGQSLMAEKALAAGLIDQIQDFATALRDARRNLH